MNRVSVIPADASFYLMLKVEEMGDPVAFCKRLVREAASAWRPAPPSAPAASTICGCATPRARTAWTRRWTGCRRSWAKVNGPPGQAFPIGIAA